MQAITVTGTIAVSSSTERCVLVAFALPTQHIQAYRKAGGVTAHFLSRTPNTLRDGEKDFRIIEDVY